MYRKCVVCVLLQATSSHAKDRHNFAIGPSPVARYRGLGSYRIAQLLFKVKRGHGDRLGRGSLRGHHSSFKTIVHFYGYTGNGLWHTRSSAPAHRLGTKTGPSRMNRQASLRSMFLRMCKIASLSLGELFRSNDNTSLYDLSCSFVACCWVLPSSTEYSHLAFLSRHILHDGRSPSHCDDTQVSIGHKDDTRYDNILTFDFRCRHPRHAAFVCVRFVVFGDVLTTPHPA